MALKNPTLPRADAHELENRRQFLGGSDFVSGVVCCRRLRRRFKAHRCIEFCSADLRSLAWLDIRNCCLAVHSGRTKAVYSSLKGSRCIRFRLRRWQARQSDWETGRSSFCARNSSRVSLTGLCLSICNINAIHIRVSPICPMKCPINLGQRGQPDLSYFVSRRNVSLQVGVTRDCKSKIA